MSAPPKPPCCGEYNCRRKNPIIIALGPFSGAVFAVTRGKLVAPNGDGSSTYQAIEKHDITEMIRFFIQRNSQWVRAVLEEANSTEGEKGHG